MLSTNIIIVAQELGGSENFPHDRRRIRIIGSGRLPTDEWIISASVCIILHIDNYSALFNNCTDELQDIRSLYRAYCAGSSYCRLQFKIF